MPVQKRVTPVMRRGRDLITQAMTGSGKTGALRAARARDHRPEPARAAGAGARADARARAADRERARLMGKYLEIGTIAVYGGTAYGPQLDAFARGAQIIVGTPGPAARPPGLREREARQAARADLRRGRRAPVARLLARHARDPEVHPAARDSPGCSRPRCRSGSCRSRACSCTSPSSCRSPRAACARPRRSSTGTTWCRRTRRRRRCCASCASRSPTRRSSSATRATTCAS